MAACPYLKVRRPPHYGVLVPDTSPPSPPEHRIMGAYGRILRPVRSRDGGYDASPAIEATQASRSGRPNSHAPIRAERPTTDSYALPLGRDETVRPRDRAQGRPLRQRPLNRETLTDRPAPLTPTQRTAHRPEQPVERGDHDSQSRPEANDARVDDEPFHHEAHGTSASVTTTRKPTLRAYTARVIERPGKRNTVAKTHFQSDLSNSVGWHVVINPCHTRLTQRQYHSPPMCSQSLQSSPDPRQQR